MKAIYSNQQDENDPLNGAEIGSDTEFSHVLDQARAKKPFFIRLLCDNGSELTIGIAENVGCIQYNRPERGYPNLVAVSARPPMKRGSVEFLTANTPTPVAARYIIGFDELKEAVLEFLRAGALSDAVDWQKLNLRALKEDVERPPDT